MININLDYISEISETLTSVEETCVIHVCQLNLHYFICSEHQELTRQIHEAKDPNLQDDLERELDHLVARMEVKGDQIAKLNRHQEMVRKV